MFFMCLFVSGWFGIRKSFSQFLLSAMPCLQGKCLLNFRIIFFSVFALIIFTKDYFRFVKKKTIITQNTGTLDITVHAIKVVH